MNTLKKIQKADTNVDSVESLLLSGGFTSKIISKPILKDFNFHAPTAQAFLGLEIVYKHIESIVKISNNLLFRSRPSLAMHLTKNHRKNVC